jgi:hypothetical protein
MSTKVASLYAEIGAKVDGFEKGAKKVKGELTDMQKGFPKLEQSAKFALTNIGLAAGAAGVAMFTLKKGFDFAKEGAQIEFTKEKFDRLAVSIGSTGDVLMNDLRTATKGTLSDMELMASATDLVGLGLVKTSKDAVRLSTVVAGLGMDMNQLVLTLANQTTMRFDQLGVAVVGFDDKVKTLKETGMDANDAFTEAFLQQAEEQLKKVGNAADTAAGSFMKLEANSKNMTDKLKSDAAKIAGPVVSALVDYDEKINHARDSLSKANPYLYQQALAFGVLTPAMNKAIADYDQVQNALSWYTEGLEDNSSAAQHNTDIVKANADAAAAHTEALKEASDGNRRYLSDLENVAAMNKKYKDGITAADAALAAGKMTTEEHASAIANLADEYDSASKKIVASMLEMKYMADGVFTDQEMNAYIGGLEKLGIITAEDAKKTRELMVQASLLEPAFASSTKGAERFDEKLKNVDGRMEDVADSGEATSGALLGIGQAAAEAHGPLSGTAMDLAKIQKFDGKGMSYYIDIWVNEHGKVPTNLGGTQGNGSSTQTGTGTANRATGGTLNGAGYTIVGEGASGWSPTAEVIVGNTVIPHDAAQWMKNAGLLGRAGHARFGEDDLSHGTHLPPSSPSKPGGGVNIPTNTGGTKPSSGTSSSTLSGVDSATLSEAVSQSVTAPMYAMQSQSQQMQAGIMQATVGAQAASANAITGELREVQRILKKMPTRDDMYAVFKGAQQTSI